MVERSLLATASNEAVGAASAWARELCEELRLATDDAYRIELVVTELVQNVVEHAAAGRANVALELQIMADGETFRLTVIDAGEAFDPLAHAPRKPPETLAEAEPGGLGIGLVRDFADQCRYERRDGTNRFEATFRLRPLAGGSAPRQARLARGSDRRRARTPASFPLERSDGERIEQEARSGRDRRLTGFISRSDLFRDVPYAQVEEIVATFPIRDIADRVVLLRPGDANDQVVVVLRGTLRVRFNALDSREYVEISDGGCVGEMSIIDSKPVSAFVVAEPGCRLLIIDAESFLTHIVSIAQVARNLVSMLSERMRRSNEIIIEQFKAQVALEQLQRDLRYARDIQASMLPREPLFAGRSEVDCVGRMRAARDVGGDFYDAALVGNDRVFVAIGDVCSKGLPAALFMVRALTTLRSEVAQPAQDIRQHLASAVERLNRHLCLSNDAQQFLTLFCGVLDLTSGTLTYVNAGHNATLLATPGTAFEFLAEPVHPIVGIVDGLRYEAAQVPMPAGSTLLLYTDGVTEAEDPGGAMFGDERLHALARGSDRLPAARLVDAVMAAVDGFAAGTPQSDDITVFALRFLRPPG